MSRKFNWRKAKLASKQKLSIADEDEYLKKGRAARWLAKVGQSELRKRQRQRQRQQQQQQQQQQQLSRNRQQG